MKSLALTLAFLLLSGLTAAAEPEATVTVDWASPIGCVNRAIFSTQGFMQIYSSENPMVLDTFLLLNPDGTHTRLETYIHQMEPQNDNADPNIFNRDAFHPQNMIRFIPDRDPFEKFLDFTGMERLSLLCYMADWLKSDDPDNPIRNINEWAEFAAAVVETYNGRGENLSPRLKYVEIWNEPNMKQFYSGTRDSYFELFNRTADRIHRDYPGVMVGGPALTHAPDCDPEGWMEDFLKVCGSRADYISYHHYGPQGEPVSVLTDDIRRWSARFRAIPGKEQGKVMLTELDAWFQGWPKIQHILERQFRFLDISDLIGAIHHFCCLAYNESGNYTFGIVDKRGGVIEGVFWPYWLFRNYSGAQSYAVRQGPRQADLDMAASWLERDGQGMGSVILHNRSDRPLKARILLYFSPADRDRVLALDRVAQEFKGVMSVKRITAGAKQEFLFLDLAPGEAAALTLHEDGRRFFAFRDLNNQEHAWTDLESARRDIRHGESCEITARVLNTTFAPLSGAIMLEGLPDGCEAVLSEGSTAISNLPFGSEHRCRFRVTVKKVIPEGAISPYAVVRSGKGDNTPVDNTPHSIPCSIDVENPIRAHVLPRPVYGVPSETNQITVQVKNTTGAPLSGRFECILPEGFKPVNPAPDFDLKPGEERRYEFLFYIPPDAAAGPRQGKVTLHFLESTHTLPVDMQVEEKTSRGTAVPLDLSAHFNLDVMAWNRNRRDFDSGHMGMFVYPADYTPSGRKVNIRGIPYIFPPLEDGMKNAVLPQGQKLTAPLGKYGAASFIGYAHDGTHHGTWILHYADGSSEKAESFIPEWCSEHPPSVRTAMNAPWRYVEGGIAPPSCQLWEWRIPVNPSKDLVALELPVIEKHGYLVSITLLPE